MGAPMPKPTAARMSPTKPTNCSNRPTNWTRKHNRPKPNLHNPVSTWNTTTYRTESNNTMPNRQQRRDGLCRLGRHPRHRRDQQRQDRQSPPGTCLGGSGHRLHPVTRGEKQRCRQLGGNGSQLQAIYLPKRLGCRRHQRHRPAATGESFGASGTTNDAEGWVTGFDPTILQNAQTRPVKTRYLYQGQSGQPHARRCHRRAQDHHRRLPAAARWLAQW